jgi:hypothetical protein
VSGPERQEQSVFVDVVKFVDDPERIAPTVIRLQKLNAILSRLTHSLYFSLREGFVFRGGSSKNGECGSFGGSPSLGENQLIGQIIQGGSEVLDGITDGCEARQGQSSLDFNPEYDISGLRLFLREGAVGAGFIVGSEQIIQVVDVLFGPFDFYVDIVERLEQEVQSIPIFSRAVKTAEVAACPVPAVCQRTSA